jgi:hypothetical protein
MAYTEFYCQAGGSNLNAGSTNNNTAAYTSTNGNWSTSTNIFIPTDGSTPASFISVGDFVSIFLDAASETPCIGRVTAVAAGVNGGITVSASFRAGTAPATGATGRTLRAGGAWLGPNGTSGFPISISGWANVANVAGNPVRINLKNDQTYSVSVAISDPGSNNNTLVQGYSSSPGDLGRATLTTSSTSVNLLSFGSMKGFKDCIFASSAASGTPDLVTSNGAGAIFQRCVFHDARGSGLLINGAALIIECEAYNCNKSNTGASGGFKSAVGGNRFIRCIAHDNAGSNSIGFLRSGNGVVNYFFCISDTNGGGGFKETNSSSGDSVYLNCDAYNNTGDGISMTFDPGNNGSVYIENCNFIKNSGAAINNNAATHRFGSLYNNGFGSGTQANGSANVLGDWEIFGSVTYASGVTPWVDPANGDFRVNLAAAIAAGRGAFMETAASYAGTTSYPDIGASQALVTAGSPETSHSFG